MNHPHRIDYYQFPSVIKPDYKPCEAGREEDKPRDLDWWQDDEDDENA